MNRKTTLILFTGFFLIAGLFFISGYMISRGLLQANLPPKPSKTRTPSFDTDTLISTQELTQLYDGPNSLEPLGILLPKNPKRKPSPDIELKKQEPLLYPSPMPSHPTAIPPSNSFTPNSYYILQ